MYRPRYLNFEVEQINVMAGGEIYYVILKTRFLGFKKDVKGEVVKKRSGCRKYKR